MGDVIADEPLEGLCAVIKALEDRVESLERASLVGQPMNIGYAHRCYGWTIDKTPGGNWWIRKTSEA